MYKPLSVLSLLFCLSNSLFSADYYWVGGSGNWSDISHWATTSGGTTFHNQAPTSNDNVFFDANSFPAPGQTVTINTDNAFCRDMNWTGATGNPVLAGSADRMLTLNGSLLLTANMAFSFTGDINFKGTQPGQQIDLAGHQLLRNVLFSGAGGEWILQSDFVVDSLVQLQNGTLNTNDQLMECAYLYIRPIQAAGLQLRNSTLRITGATFFTNIFIKYPVSLIQNTGFTLDPGGSTIEFTADDVDVIVEGGGPALSFHKVLFSAPAGETYLQVQPGGQLTFDSLLFSNGAEVLGTMQFDYLELAPGKGYSFESGITYTIGELQAAGQCEAPIQILGSSAGEAAVFQSTTGPVNVSYVSIKDIHASGGASFIAENSADLGNNNGWTINTSSMNDLYWVGGSGNWDDPQHWSFTSGGAGGACVPTGADNVYFDANSFNAPGQTVRLNLDNALCRNMDWTGADGTPVLAGTINQNLRIFGSLTFITNMQVQLGGDIYLQSAEPGNTVATGNHLFTRSVIFDGAGGEWALLDSLKAIREVVFVKGHLRTNDQTVVAHSLRSEQAFTRQLSLGASHIYLRDYDFTDNLYWPTFRLESFNLTFDAGTSTIEYLTYGEHVVSGSTPVDFNIVIFDVFGVLSLWDDSNVYIDTLIHHESTVYYGGGCHIGSWQLDGGYEYVLSQDRNYTIDNLVLNNDCNALVYIHSGTNGVQTNIQSNNVLTGEYLQLKDINNNGANDFIANNSVDLGNNQNLTINEVTSRTLYWVGDGGQWSDPVHWSLTSGGPGGECIPTSVDDVIFDANSFSTPGQGVFGSMFPQNYCHDITWREVTNTPAFNMPDVLVFGSLEFSENMTVSIGGLRFSGLEEGNTIDTKGQYVNYTNFEGAGSYILLSGYRGFGLNLSGGTWNTNGFPVELAYFHSFGIEVQRTLILGNSHITITGNMETVGTFPLEWASNLQLDAGASLIEFTSPNANMAIHHHLSQSHTLHNVLFSAEEGVSLVEPRYGTRLFINKLQFNSDGIINSENTIDSLIFTAGKSYQLEANKTQTIREHWQIIGNNCLSIELSSTVPGLPSTVTMAGGQVDGDFIQMRDQIATGGALFYAGSHSTDIGGSNTGWIFDSAEDFVEVGFLGEDVVLCNNSSITISADNRSPNETYVWSDGSTGDAITVSAAGTYWAEVSFTDNCTIRDSILVFAQEDFSVDLGEDTAICTGDTLVLDATVNALGIQYRWQDDSTDPLYQVTADGEYKVELTLSGCTFQDSIQVALKPLPDVDLGDDLTICEGDQILIGSSIDPRSTVLWSDGSTGATLNVAQAGVYWQEVTLDGCSRRDSLAVSTQPSPVVDLGPDRAYCDGETVTLDVTNVGATYSWQDGSTGSTLDVAVAGNYEVTVDLDGCIRQDQVQISFKPLPVFDLGDDQRTCEGETVSLDGTVPGAAYNWSDGRTTAAITVQTTGEYRLITTLDGCIYRDSVNVLFNPNPVVDLGSDQELCQGENLILDAANDGATYQWQDGSTDATFNATTTGNYEVIVNLDGCIRQDQIQLTFKPLPAFDLGADRTPCEGETVTLDGAVVNATVRWSDGSTDELLNVMTSGLYWLEATLDGCSRRDSVAVNYVVLPKMALGADQVRCEGETVTLDVTFSGAQYQWQDGSTAPNFTVDREGTFWVAVSVGSCVERDTVQFTYNPTPRFDLGADLLLCEDESRTFSLSPEADTYRWQDGSNAASLTVSYPGGLIWGEVTQDGCVFRDSVQVDYRQFPIINLGPDTLICENEPFSLNAGNVRGQIRWQDGSTGVTYEVNGSGTYRVEVADGPCLSSDEIVIDTRECIYFELYMPNAFSPNEDGDNDLIRPFVAPGVQILQYTYTIFDRWGNQLFLTTNPDEDWDGSWNGRTMPAGVYIYFIELEYMDERGGGTELFTGDITLLR